MVEQGQRGVGLYFTGGIWKHRAGAYLIRKNARGLGLLPESGADNRRGADRSCLYSSRLSLTGRARSKREIRRPGRTGFAATFHMDFPDAADRSAAAVLTLGKASSERRRSIDPGGTRAGIRFFAAGRKWSGIADLRVGRETGKPAYWSNMVDLWSVSFTLAENLKLEATLHTLGAAQAEGPSALLSGTGRDGAGCSRQIDL